jgi:hypothetical protein
MTRILDILFRVIGTEVSADHGYALFGALSRILESDCDRWLHGNAPGADGDVPSRRVRAF